MKIPLVKEKIINFRVNPSFLGLSPASQVHPGLYAVVGAASVVGGVTRMTSNNLHPYKRF